MPAIDAFIFNLLVSFWCHSNIFFLCLRWCHYLDDCRLEWVSVSLCVFVCVFVCARIVMPARVHVHALITLRSHLSWSASSYINGCLQRYQLHKLWQYMGLLFFPLQSQTMSVPAVVETVMLLERLSARAGIATASICIVNEVHRHSRRPSHFTGSIFGLFPSPGGTSCESHTVV